VKPIAALNNLPSAYSISTILVPKDRGMKILYINNDGGGFADHIEVIEGATVRELFEQRIKHGSAGDYLIRVNRQPAAADKFLREGDRISFTPTKIEGAQ